MNDIEIYMVRGVKRTKGDGKSKPDRPNKVTKSININSMLRSVRGCGGRRTCAKQELGCMMHEGLEQTTLSEMKLKQDILDSG